jgi:hypothetical protein
MAYVTEVYPLPSTGGTRRHSECTCGWKITERDETRVVQPDTDGSSERQDHGTVSQSLQLDEARAKELVRVLHTAFSNL